MTIREEAPEIFERLGGLTELERITEDMDGEDVARQALNPGSEIAECLNRARAAQREYRAMIAAHDISEAAKVRFINAVDRDLNDVNVGARINFCLHPLLYSTCAHGDWFDRRAFNYGSALDASVYFSVIHPDLLNEAKGRWSDNPRVNFMEMGAARTGPDVREELLEKHGIYPDLSKWFWAFEALDVSAKAMARINLKFRLCDYVRWSCTGKPPNISADEKFGDPELYLEARFGERLADAHGCKRLDGCVIWKLADGEFVSPLWEYLGWRGDNGCGELGECSRHLAYIGEGLDAAVLAHDLDRDPFDKSRVRLTPAKIFRAGEAMMALRVKMELGDHVSKGRTADVVTAKRAKKGGLRSALARESRRAALLDAMEVLGRRNPDLVKLGQASVAAMALAESMESSPDLWSQGQGQIEHYLGEIRRGEAGADMQARFRTLFPNKTA